MPRAAAHQNLRLFAINYGFAVYFFFARAVVQSSGIRLQLWEILVRGFVSGQTKNGTPYNCAKKVGTQRGKYLLVSTPSK